MPTPAPTDVFISYAREDRDTAQALALAFEGHGIAVWWDREIPLGRDFAEEIATQLDAAHMVCVLWSRNAVVSGFVRDEAARARDAGKLLPVRIADVALPLGFGTLQTLDLIDWDGSADDQACRIVIDAVAAALAVHHAADTAPMAMAMARSTRPQPLTPQRQPSPGRRLAVWLALSALLVAGLGWGGWNVFQAREARFHLGEGLKAQFARDPNLEAARTEYLFALAAAPDLASAHYYLGHVYAQLKQAGAAREQFLAAIQIGEGLDGDQRREAEQLLRTLASDAEPAALVSTAPPPAAVAPAPRPSPIQPPTATQGVGAAPGAPLEAPPTVPPNLAQLEGLSRRIPASAELARDSRALVDALFGADVQARLNAITTLALTPSQSAEVVPLAVERALAGLRSSPDDPAARQGLNATLTLLQNASAMTLLFGRAEIAQLLDRASPLSPALHDAADKVRSRLARAGTRAPVVFLQIAVEAQRPLAEALSRRFVDAGYDTPGIELVGPGRAPSRSEIRAQGTSHLGLGRWQRKQVQELSGELPVLLVLRKAEPHVDTYEVWLDRDLCVATDRRVAGCGG